MMNLESLINKFLFLIRSCWKELLPVFTNDETGSLKEDWLQANWELIVEGPLCKNGKIYLEVYGDGADANGSSSRILYPDKLANHRVYCLSKRGHFLYDYLNKTQVEVPKDGFHFDRFVSIRKDGWYYEEPPFDKVLINNNIPIVLAVSDLNFILKKL